MGTDAAAATGVAIVPTGGSRTAVFHTDRPFLICDSKTGAVLFIGRAHDPSGWRKVQYLPFFRRFHACHDNSMTPTRFPCRILSPLVTKK